MRRLRKHASKGSIEGGRDDGGGGPAITDTVKATTTPPLRRLQSTGLHAVTTAAANQQTAAAATTTTTTGPPPPSARTRITTSSAAKQAAPEPVSMNAMASAPKLSPEVFKNFEKTGKTEFLKFIKQQVKDHDNPVFDKKGEFKYGISRAIYELLWQGLTSAVKKDTVLNTLTEVVSLHEDFPSMVLDIINILDAETSLMTDGIQEERSMFSQIVKDLDKVIPDKLIKERLEIDTLQDVGIVKNKVFYTKFIKIKTKLYYKQRRFNLFREESEGYAKLITELNQDFEEDVTASSVMDLIKSLIGCFNLDPNRVLDIIIESFETRPERRKLFIPLLRTYMPTGSIICEVLGYKFRYFADTQTPKSLFQICALLLKYNVIDLNDIYVWLSPTDKTIANDWEQELADAKEYVRKLNVIVTNKDKEPAEQETEKEYDEEKYHANQKFGLCEALLRIGDWENAHKIIEKLPEHSVVVHESIAEALIELLHIAVDHLYTTMCFRNARPYKSRLCEDSKLLQKIQARDFKELRNFAIPMAITLGPSLHYDTVLMHKMVRILRTIISEMGVDSLNQPPQDSEAEALYYEVMTLMDACILPALSYLDANCPMAEEIWSVLKYFPYHFRYSLYGRWKNDTFQMHPMLIRRRGNAQKSIKAQMKRLSKENVKFVGRLIGKLSHCAPGFLFDYVLLQIQIYENLIGPVVDSLKYLTSLSFDCLGYCIIEALARADRDRFKHDGTSISLWLQSLSSFCGAIFKKYNIELSGLLQYVANQLKSQKSLDLLILKEIVQKMAGVETVEEMTNEQLNAMSGGELLRGEAGYFSQVRNTKKSSQRLKDALANNDLAVAISLLMAQQKHCVIYRETAQSHLKLVGKLYDQCQDTLVQFGTFLGSTYSVDEYVERLPSIIVMLQEYHINTDVAFFLARPMFTHQITQKYDQLRKADPNSKKLTQSQKLQKYLEATNLIMDPIVESVRPLHGPKIWEDISPQFLVTFWSLSMYDLQVPSDSYQKEISKLKQMSLQAADAKDSNASKNKKEQERYIALMDKLQDERKKQQEHVDKTLQRLHQEKDGWFLSRSAKSAKNETITQFLQLCLFPRCTFTALDALYCAKFVHTIHNLKANNFSTLLCYDRIFCDITYSVTSCTENEATRYGRFLCAMLETVMRWHADQATFNKECANYPGFVTKFRVSNQFSEANDHVGYENYRHVCHKWHYKITKAIVFCLDSKDYMQIRNALIILMRILPHYPVLSKLAQIIERKVEKVREEEKNKRPDLFVIATSYIGKLKLKTPHMLKESDFHQVTERVSRTEAAAAAAAAAAQNATQTAGTPSTAEAPPAGATPAPAAANAASNAATAASGAASPNDNGPAVVKQVSNGDVKIDKREKDRPEKGKIIKLNQNDGLPPPSAATLNSSSTVSTSNLVTIGGGSNNRHLSSGANAANNASELKDEYLALPGGGERDMERRSTSRSMKEAKREERTRERDRDRERGERSERGERGERSERLERSERPERSERGERADRGERLNNEHRQTNSQMALEDLLESVGSAAAAGSLMDGGQYQTSTSSSRSKREKRREERYHIESSPMMDAVDAILETKSQHHQQHYHEQAQHHHHDYERGRDRDRDRDLSSVSNESNGSLHRRSQEVMEYEKVDSKRRKLEATSSSSSSNSKKQIVDDLLENVKKDRGLKSKERKEKMTDEERDARKERKLGRKRERLDENPSGEHKRRRDVQNGDDDLRERDKYHTREKTPHMREGHERSHEKFERDRGARDDRSYGPAKSTRSRIGY